MEMKSSSATHQVVFLDVARVISAQIVLIAHARGAMFADYKTFSDPPAWFKLIALISGFGGQAVVIFFVISGWQVGGKLLNAELTPLTLLHYLVDRVSRLWAVLLPMFLLCAALGIAGLLPAAASIDPLTFIGNLFGLQTLTVDLYANNRPLWSLANETFYYGLFPLILAAAKLRGRWITFLASYSLAFLYLAPPVFWGYFLIWLAGALAAGRSLDARLSKIALPAFLATLMAFRVYRLDYDIRWDSVIAILFIFAACSTELGTTWKRCIKVPALFTFSLYVTHYPILLAAAHPKIGLIGSNTALTFTALLQYGLLLLACNLFAGVFYWAFERHYVTLRSLLKAQLSIAHRKDLTLEPNASQHAQSRH